MKHSWLLILLLVIIASTGLVLFTSPFSSPQTKNTQTTVGRIPTPTPKVVDLTAGFAVFTNGTFRIFTDPKYHNLSSDVFIEPPQVNIIRVKKDGITYQDFFNTLPMKIDSTCLTTGTGQVFCTGNNNKLRFFINGKEDPNALQKKIGAKDKLLITFGNLTSEEIKNQTTRIPTP